VTVQLVIRDGLVVDGTGAPAHRADIAIDAGRIVDVSPRYEGLARRIIQADGLTVTPGFVDVHTHLDAEFGWDPLPLSTAPHGITTVVTGNCGVSFAPVRHGQAAVLAELMQSVEDIPSEAILRCLPFDWTTYGGYLNWLEGRGKATNVGGLVGHCAVRIATMGERAFDPAVSAQDTEKMTGYVDEALASGALGFSTSRTILHTVPDGRPVPGTFATIAELFAIGEVLGRHGRGVIEVGARFAGPAEDDYDAVLNMALSEVTWMGELSRHTRRPVTVGLAQTRRFPGLYREILQEIRRERMRGAALRPQSPSRCIAMLTCLDHRTPFDRAPAWRALRELPMTEKLQHLSDPQRRDLLVRSVHQTQSDLDMKELYVMPEGAARYVFSFDDSLFAHAQRRGVAPVEAFIDLNLERQGQVMCVSVFANVDIDEVGDMIDDPMVLIGLGDAGAHVGQMMDASQPVFVLSYWVRDRRRWTLEEGVRRLTSDTADFFHVEERGTVSVGAWADLNLIDLERLSLSQPVFTRDLPTGGRFLQRSEGIVQTFVNGEVVMDCGEPTGALPGAVLRGGTRV
jgi:N-acyl-D-aspartate/D-glutamate deacylase